MGADRDAHRAAAAAHLSAVLVALAAAVAIPGPVVIALVVAPLGPVAVKLLSRRAPAFVRGHAREAVRFCLSAAFYASGLALAMVAVARAGGLADVYAVLVFVELFGVLSWGSFIAMAGGRALRGREWRYPFTIGRRGMR